jgi:hypothetical protein
MPASATHKAQTVGKTPKLWACHASQYNTADANTLSKPVLRATLGEN